MATKNIHKHDFQVSGAQKVEDANKRVAMSLRGITRASRRVNSTFSRTGQLFGAQTLGIVTVGLALRKVIKDYSDYDDSLARIRTTLSAANGELGNTAVKASGVSEIMSRRLAFSVTESNNAMNTLLQTGIDTHKAMRIFETGLQLARVAEMDTGDAMQFMVDSMNAFNVEAERNGESAQEFSRRMVSQLSVAANSAATSMGQLQNAFRYAGGELAGFGYQSGEVIAALASMSVGGIRGSSAGTRLRGAIAALNSPSRKTTAIFEKFGISADELKNTFYDTSTGALRPLEQGMERMGDLFKRMGRDVDRNQALLRLYGRRALIAGMSLSDMGKIAEKFHEIQSKFRGDDQFAQLAEDIRTGAVIDRQAEQRMQSFGVQVEQTKLAVEELAIGFGEILFAGLQKGNQGFGTYLRNLAGNMRLARLGSRRTGEQSTEWDRLSQAEKDSAKELADFLTTTAEAIKTIGNATIEIGKFVGKHREIIIRGGIAIIVLKKLFGAAAILGKIAGGTALSIGTMGIATLTAIEYLKEFGGRAIRNSIFKLIGLDNKLNEVSNTMGGKFAESIRDIPLIGPLLAQWGEFLGILEMAWDTLKKITGLKEQEDRQSRTREKEFRSSNDIMSDFRQREMGAGREVTEESTQQFAIQEKSRAINRLAAAQVSWFNMERRRVLAGQGTFNDTRRQLQQRLSGAGIGEEDIENVTSRVWGALSRQNIDATQREAERLGITSENTAEKTGLLADQINGLNQIISNINLGTIGLGNPTFEQDMSNTTGMTMLQDGYIRRGGMVGVSTGDIVVSRSHLADAVGGPRGSMVSAITGQSQPTIQPPGGGGGGSMSLQADVPVILQLDGTEIARAVGKVHLRHLERSGTSIQPGQRRTLAESGFSESRR